ncbi:MAG: dimethyl sulfoxide reductase anchor subunit [Actinomycetaceae bacterium]|nr:dimethyl sulfoxide reductase anchor subunit [Actinomycetaceae bacterium]
MNMHELPMIIFTVVAQMSIGAFITLGVLHVWVLRFDSSLAKRIIEPIQYAIGPVLVFGLMASMLHMNDPFNVLNVFRHWDSSWLSREIITGIGFSGFGFLYAASYWWRLGGQVLQGILAAVTAVFGVLLLVSMSMIYYSVEKVPAWHTPILPVQFTATSVLLGVLYVACVLVLTIWVRNRLAARVKTLSPPAKEAQGVWALLRLRENTDAINAPTSDEEWRASQSLLQGLAIVAGLAGSVLLITYPLHFLNLSEAGPVGAQALGAFAGPFFMVRLLLLGASAIVLSGFIVRVSHLSVRDTPRVIVTLTVVTFVLCFAGEMMGRSLHYDSMVGFGI